MPFGGSTPLEQAIEHDRADDMIWDKGSRIRTTIKIEDFQSIFGSDFSIEISSIFGCSWDSNLGPWGRPA